MSQRDEWHFESASGERGVCGFTGSLMLGPYYIAGILQTAGVAVRDWHIGAPNFGTPEFIERIVRVLNRELPEGKLRVRRKGVKNGRETRSESDRAKAMDSHNS